MLGVAFIDHIETERHKGKARNLSLESIELSPAENASQDTYKPILTKQIAIKTITFLLFFVLFARLITLQIIKGNYYNGLADSNRIIKRPIEASRGVITDRKGDVLARNTPYFKYTGEEKLYTHEEYLQRETTSSANKKTSSEVQSIREYKYSEILSHSIGYISAITSSELENNKKNISFDKKIYSASDIVGRTGLEEQYEDFLKGKDGSEFVEVDSYGELQKIIATNPPVSGYTIHTTIDAQLQKYAYEELQRSVKENEAVSGVIIVQRPKTGEILAIVNYPSFDSNVFTHPEKLENVTDLFRNEQKPLLNRSIGGTYAPGSTYKMITGLAGLESGTINTSSTYEDTGNIEMSGIVFNNWYFTQYGKTEGSIDLKKALARSNDTFFYKLSLAMGPEKLIEESYKFRLGQTLGIDIPGETKGLIPTPEWKKQVIKEQWYPGNTINMSIGQGDVLTTPLQILSMTSTIANGGTIYPPSLVSKITDGDNHTICKKDFQTNSWKESACSKLNNDAASVVNLRLQAAHLELIREGMKMVNQKGGTAAPFFDFSIETAGKTGTAESIQGQKPHAWYTGFAPYTNPEITVTVLEEKAGEGSKVAAPLAKKIMEWYFNNK